MNLTQDGMVVAQRFSKAIDTVRAKHTDKVTGEYNKDKADAEIRGLCRYKFGLSLEEFLELVGTKQFYKLAIQRNRHEHQQAQERATQSALADELARKMFTFDMD